MEEKDMNRTVYPLRFKNKGWKIANKCAEIFVILLVAGAEAFLLVLYDGWVLNLIGPGEPQVGDRILLLWPILPCVALLVALIVQLPKPKTIVLTDWSLSILRHNLMGFPYRWGFNESVSLSKIQRFEVKEYRRSDWTGRSGAYIPVVGMDLHRLVQVSTDLRWYYVPVDDPEAFVADLTARMEKAGKYRRFDGIWRDKAEDHIQ